MPDKIVNGQSGTPVPTNLTDSEIVKALECCNHIETDCELCPLYTTKECSKVMLDSTLDLINRLQEEKEALINGQETLQKYIANLQAENENYSKNNRQMTSDILKLYKGLEQAKAENERLKTQLYLEKYTDVAKKNIKAEAYKEFAERLKGAKQYSIERHENIVPVAVIDWILKELVGE